MMETAIQVFIVVTALWAILRVADWLASGAK